MFENLFLTLIMNLNFDVFVPSIMSSGPSNFAIPYIAYKAGCFFFLVCQCKGSTEGCKLNTSLFCQVVCRWTWSGSFLLCKNYERLHQNYTVAFVFT